MSLKSYALTTVARVKTYADISTSDDDTLLESIVNAVTEYIESYTGKRFKQTAYSNQEMDSDGSEFLFLEHYPVSTTASFTLQERESGENEDDWSTVDSNDYFIDYDTGVITVANGKFIKGTKKYRSSYTAGYDFDNATTYLSDTTAGDIELAAWELSKSTYNSRRGSSNVESESIGSYSVKFAAALYENENIKAILDKYRGHDGIQVLGPDRFS